MWECLVISVELLDNLFRLSNFDLRPEEIKQWQSDVSEWVDFFSLKDAPDINSDYQFLGNRSIYELRSDHEGHQSFSSADIKLYSHRFVDGFIALPKHKRDF